jgi:hypothetical protein
VGTVNVDLDTGDLRYLLDLVDTRHADLSRKLLLSVQGKGPALTKDETRELQRAIAVTVKLGAPLVRR